MFVVGGRGIESNEGNYIPVCLETKGTAWGIKIPGINIYIKKKFNVVALAFFSFPDKSVETFNIDPVPFEFKQSGIYLQC